MSRRYALKQNRSNKMELSIQVEDETGGPVYNFALTTYSRLRNVKTDCFVSHAWFIHPNIMTKM